MTSKDEAMEVDAAVSIPTANGILEASPAVQELTENEASSMEQKTPQPNASPELLQTVIKHVDDEAVATAIARTSDKGRNKRPKSDDDDEADDTEHPNKQHKPTKHRYAILFGYNGKKYHGLQM